MNALTSCCALYDCEDCGHRLEKRCIGCRPGNEQLGRAPEGACAVYSCVTSRGLDSCDGCRETACVLRRSVEAVCPLRSRFENKRWWAGRMSRALAGRKGPASPHAEEKMSERVVTRLRWYMTALDLLAEQGEASVSSWQLAERVGVSAALIRKDLSRFGEFGTPSFGYRTDYLRERIRSILRLDKPRGIAWVGACAYRHYAAALRRLDANNCRVVGLFDVDPTEIGLQAGDLPVLPADHIADALAKAEVSAGVVAVPGPQAQEISEALVRLGATAILNLSGQLLVLPDHVRVCSLDLAGELLELCYYC